MTLSTAPDRPGFVLAWIAVVSLSLWAMATSIAGPEATEAADSSASRPAAEQADPSPVTPALLGDTAGLLDGGFDALQRVETAGAPHEIGQAVPPGLVGCYGEVRDVDARLCVGARVELVDLVSGTVLDSTQTRANGRFLLTFALQAANGSGLVRASLGQRRGEQQVDLAAAPLAALRLELSLAKAEATTTVETTAGGRPRHVYRAEASMVATSGNFVRRVQLASLPVQPDEFAGVAAIHRPSHQELSLESVPGTPGRYLLRWMFWFSDQGIDAEKLQAVLEALPEPIAAKIRTARRLAHEAAEAGRVDEFQDWFHARIAELAQKRPGLAELVVELTPSEVDALVKAVWNALQSEDPAALPRLVAGLKRYLAQRGAGSGAGA
ncbi:MAG TPA: hypothetical protein VGC54_08980 [Planctomycetota bacterium]